MIESPVPTIGVFLSSSDSRRDILERIFPSMLKYWPDCPYKIYVGVNSEYTVWPGITSLIAPPSDWRSECLEQVRQICESHIIVILDDFLFLRPVDQQTVAGFVSIAVTSQAQYFRLLPLGRPLWERLGIGSRVNPINGVEEINATRPFFSSLQIAIWDKTHITSMLRARGSIWDFEHERMPKARHYAISQNPPILYRHLVEKGRWLPYAKAMLAKAGLPTNLGNRPIWSRWRNVKLIFDAIRFYIFGYSIH
jgi:hypothetical protein